MQQLNLLDSVDFSGGNARTADKSEPIKYDGKIVMAIVNSSRQQARYSLSFSKFCMKHGIKPRKVAVGFTPNKECIAVFDNDQQADNNMIVSSNYVAENKNKVNHIFEVVGVIKADEKHPEINLYFTMTEVIKGVFRLDFIIPDDINAAKVELERPEIFPGKNIPGSKNF